MLPNACHVERRADGLILVRMRSRDRQGRALPDAVFSFRPGDCQYAKWDQYLRRMEGESAIVDPSAFTCELDPAVSNRQTA